MVFFNFLKKSFKSKSVGSLHTEVMTAKQAESIAEQFGAFLSGALPIIKDARLLPYPKEKIDQALTILVSNLKRQSGSQVKKLIDAFEFSQVALKAFAPIDPEDHQLVDYLNKFGSVSQVPKEHQKACVDLFVKYQSRGMGV